MTLSPVDIWESGQGCYIEVYCAKVATSDVEAAGIRCRNSPSTIYLLCD